MTAALPRVNANCHPLSRHRQQHQRWIHQINLSQLRVKNCNPKTFIPTHPWVVKSTISWAATSIASLCSTAAVLSVGHIRCPFHLLPSQASQRRKFLILLHIRLNISTHVWRPSLFLMKRSFPLVRNTLIVLITIPLQSAPTMLSYLLLFPLRWCILQISILVKRCL